MWAGWGQAGRSRVGLGGVGSGLGGADLSALPVDSSGTLRRKRFSLILTDRTFSSDLMDPGSAVYRITANTIISAVSRAGRGGRGRAGLGGAGRGRAGRSGGGDGGVVSGRAGSGDQVSVGW